MPIDERPLAASPAQTSWSAAHSRTRWLDGLRGLAALFVVLHHMWLASWPFFPENQAPWWLGWLLYGHLGVAVFIVVSGYSLTLAPVRHGGTLIGGTRRFLRRRAWRILPAYWAALVLSTVAYVAVLHPDAGSATMGKSFVIHAALLQDVFGNVPPNGTFWSIAVEWQIYFVFPLILLAARRTTMLVAVALTAVVVMTAYTLSHHAGTLLAKIGHLSPQFLLLFALGVLAAWTANSPARVGSSPALRRAVAALAAVLMAAVVALAVGKGSAWMTEHWFWVDVLFGTAVAGGLFLTAQSERRWRAATLGSRPIVLLGSFSYSLYLVHAPVLESLQRFGVGKLGGSAGVNFVLLLVFALPVVLLVSYGFFRLFERPFLDRRDLASLRTLPLVEFLSGGRRATRPALPPAPIGASLAPAPAAGDHAHHTAGS